MAGAPRPRVEKITELTTALDFLSEAEATAFLATVLYGASDRLIAEKFGSSVRRVRRARAEATQMLRLQSADSSLSDYRTGEGDGGTLLIDEGLRSLIREWRLDEAFTPVCIQCGKRYPPQGPERAQARSGRRRKYCSNACRQKAYRARRR
ncbi:hypothetical protein [Streptomyces sp. NPDC005046]